MSEPKKASPPAGAPDLPGASVARDTDVASPEALAPEGDPRPASEATPPEAPEAPEAPLTRDWRCWAEGEESSHGLELPIWADARWAAEAFAETFTREIWAAQAFGPIRVSVQPASPEGDATLVEHFEVTVHASYRARSLSGAKPRSTCL